MSGQFARNKADQLLKKFHITECPIDVEQLARRLDLFVLHEKLGPELSGLLIKKQQGTFICVNAKHPASRRRFTIAHEIGHYILGHQLEAGEHVHVDEGNYISARGPRAATGLDPKEVEANQFAAALLMPVEAVKRAAAKVRGRAPRLLDTHVEELAKRFGVSEQAMTIRLDVLDLL